MNKGNNICDYEVYKCIEVGTFSLSLVCRFWEMAQTFTGLKLQGFLGRFGKTTTTDIEGYMELPDGKVSIVIKLCLQVTCTYEGTLYILKSTAFISNNRYCNCEYSEHLILLLQLINLINIFP